MVRVCAVVLASAFSSSASPPVPSACCLRSSSLMFGWRCLSCKSCVLLSPLSSHPLVKVFAARFL
ncbi:hypothetical protein PF002_g10492 [Phytophthora fragariae]|uniref:Secreted protein n=1 Tax=Phytophthora fragariae TaxID=53985 RepID=A0A6A3THT9_9STRA|nr:hypothetical protein PF003_g35161 [Phytophthora fragariae]KAE8965713.1 hypothetical protein PF011_g28187 [Phytophthora fragariae]KAE9136672.1 hypothetical protein PF007_g2114 [Phytophthora fragariae]KAE9239000.1 hypothetical protein PF002_g10492 [Phytophthora fragariae]